MRTLWYLQLMIYASHRLNASRESTPGCKSVRITAHELGSAQLIKLAMPFSLAGNGNMPDYAPTPETRSQLEGTNVKLLVNRALSFVFI